MEKTSYHSHTEYCNHAKGTAADMVAAAYKSNFKVFGVSEHVFFDGEEFSPRRTSKEDQDSLLYKELPALKEEYKGKMEVMSALECEWFPKRLKYLKELSMDPSIDYLILGNHYRETMADDRAYPIIVKDDHELLNYTNSTIEAMESGLFAYVAHPDAFMMGRKEFGSMEAECSERIIDKAVELDIPLGLNINRIGASKHRGQLDFEWSCPNYNFFEIVAQKGAKVILELDAHQPEVVMHEELWNYGVEMCNKLELNRITRLDLDKYKKNLGKN